MFTLFSYSDENVTNKMSITIIKLLNTGISKQKILQCKRIMISMMKNLKFGVNIVKGFLYFRTERLLQKKEINGKNCSAAENKWITNVISIIII